MLQPSGRPLSGKGGPACGTSVSGDGCIGCIFVASTTTGCEVGGPTDVELPPHQQNLLFCLRIISSIGTRITMPIAPAIGVGPFIFFAKNDSSAGGRANAYDCVFVNAMVESSFVAVIVTSPMYDHLGAEFHIVYP